MSIERDIIKEVWTPPDSVQSPRLRMYRGGNDAEYETAVGNQRLQE
jgi:hypothetical protein